MRLRPDQLLWLTATLLVAVTFFVAGSGKVLAPAANPSMVDRYLDSAQSIRAVGLIEVGLALWLISARTPRWAAAFAAFALTVFSILIAIELNRTRPLPCGCLPMVPGVDSFAIRKGLWISLGRNVFLIAMCALSAWLSLPLKAQATPTSSPVRRG
jgi:uncharacterized membrane protein YphA (DoxX/SURF4 family)